MHLGPGIGGAAAVSGLSEHESSTSAGFTEAALAWGATGARQSPMPVASTITSKTRLSFIYPPVDTMMIPPFGKLTRGTSPSKEPSDLVTCVTDRIVGPLLP